MCLNTPCWKVQCFEDQERCWCGQVLSEGISYLCPPCKQPLPGAPAAAWLCQPGSCRRGAWPEQQVRRPPPQRAGVAADWLRWVLDYSRDKGSSCPACQNPSCLSEPSFFTSRLATRLAWDLCPVYQLPVSGSVVRSRAPVGTKRQRAAAFS